MDQTPTTSAAAEESDRSDNASGVGMKAVSRHAQYFKQGIKPKTQQERRNILLEEIKMRRNNVMYQKRRLNELFEQENSEQKSDEPLEQISEEPLEQMEVDENQKPKKQKFKLMLSEWLSDVPNDLEEKWLIKFCPKGYRRMIIAHKHKTISFDKFGLARKKFNSLLPGGDRTSNGHNFTVFDCIYSGVQRCYYVLDILSWNSFSFINCSAEFRFFFLKSKMYEHPELQEISTWNNYSFIEVPDYPSQLSILEHKLSVPYELEGTELKLDGILFYYKEMFYMKGYSPFLGWLKPYMIPEIFNLPVSDHYMDDKPQKYINLTAHMAYAAKKIEERKRLEEPGQILKMALKNADRYKLERLIKLFNKKRYVLNLR